MLAFSLVVFVQTLFLCPNPSAWLNGQCPFTLQKTALASAQGIWPSSARVVFFGMVEARSDKEIGVVCFSEISDDDVGDSGWRWTGHCTTSLTVSFAKMATNLNSDLSDLYIDQHSVRE